MPFNISELNATINKHGLAKNNLFEIKIYLSDQTNFLNQMLDAKVLTFLCKSADLPALDVTTADYKPYTFGQTQRRPTGMTLPILPTVFMVDSNFGVIKFFQRWIQHIVNFNTSSGMLSEVGGALPYEMNYMDNYSCSIQVTVYSGNQTDKTYTYWFHNAYPVSVGNQTVSWENNAEVMTLPVQFSYDSMYIDSVENGQVTGDTDRSSNGILSYLSSLNTFGQAVKNLNRPRNIQDLVNTVTDVNTILGALK